MAEKRAHCSYDSTLECSNQEESDGAQNDMTQNSEDSDTNKNTRKRDLKRQRKAQTIGN